MIYSLYHCFKCNGCHISGSDLKLLINTVLEWWATFDLSPDFFSFIILTYSQFEIIDELVLIMLEDLCRKRLLNKTKLRVLLRETPISAVKALLAFKIQESKAEISEETFENNFYFFFYFYIFIPNHLMKNVVRKRRV